MGQNVYVSTYILCAPLPSVCLYDTKAIKFNYIYFTLWAMCPCVQRVYVLYYVCGICVSFFRCCDCDRVAVCVAHIGACPTRKYIIQTTPKIIYSLRMPARRHTHTAQTHATTDRAIKCILSSSLSSTLARRNRRRRCVHIARGGASYSALHSNVYVIFPVTWLFFHSASSTFPSFFPISFPLFFCYYFIQFLLWLPLLEVTETWV